MSNIAPKVEMSREKLERKLELEVPKFLERNKSAIRTLQEHPETRAAMEAMLSLCGGYAKDLRTEQVQAMADFAMNHSGTVPRDVMQDFETNLRMLICDLKDARPRSFQAVLEEFWIDFGDDIVHKNLMLDMGANVYGVFDSLNTFFDKVSTDPQREEKKFKGIPDLTDYKIATEKLERKLENPKAAEFFWNLPEKFDRARKRLVEDPKPDQTITEAIELIDQMQEYYKQHMEPALAQWELEQKANKKVRAS